MKKFSILIVLGFILCIGLVGATGYYIGSKTQKPVQQSKDIYSTSEVATDTDALKAKLKEEVRAELYDEVYEEAYDAAYKAIEADLDAKINELQEEAKVAEEEAKATKNTETTESPKKDTNTNNTNNTNNSSVKPSTTERPTVQAYINVHDVTASASGGTAAIESALNGAVDSSSGTVTCNTSAITGIGTFPIYWTSTDGATATSYITITE